jgi:hypothetical protein
MTTLIYRGLAEEETNKMRDEGNFERTECDELEAEIRAMCDRLKFVAPPAQYSLEDAVETIGQRGADIVAAQNEIGLLPSFTLAIGGPFRAMTAVFTMQRLSNVASSIIVFMMLMIIPLALFSNPGMAMNSAASQASWSRGSAETEEDLKLECTKYMCGDERYEK